MNDNDHRDSLPVLVLNEEDARLAVGLRFYLDHSDRWQLRTADRYKGIEPLAVVVVVGRAHQWKRHVEHARKQWRRAPILLVVEKDFKKLPFSECISAGVQLTTPYDKKGDYAKAIRSSLERMLDNSTFSGAPNNAAQIAKAEFLAVMSHEIRTPMNAIIGFTELLMEGKLDERQADYAEIVKQNGKTLLELVDNMLEYSRIESGTPEFEPASFDLHGLLNEVVDAQSTEAERKAIQLTLDIEESVPKKIVGLASELRRILINLIGNGVKFTESGSVRVSVSREPNLEKPKLLFRIRDTGIGIAPANVERLFTRFSQLDSSARRRHGGTGLGLAISKKLCEAIGGEMWVTSAPGKGSNFSFTMPYRPLEKADGALDMVRWAEDDLPHLRVLVVEDEPMNQLLLQRFLTKLGQEFEVADNGIAALQALQHGHFDMVLMDVQMPEMDGLEATRRIRAGEAGAGCKDLYICALTAYSTSGNQERCLEVGMNEYLTKPISMKNLKRVIAASQPRSSIRSA